MKSTLHYGYLEIAWYKLKSFGLMLNDYILVKYEFKKYFKKWCVFLIGTILKI